MPRSAAERQIVQPAHWPTKADLGARIKAERIRVGLSMSEAARRLKMTRQSYRAMERGSTIPYRTLIGAVSLLGMNPQALAPELFHAMEGVE